MPHAPRRAAIALLSAAGLVLAVPGLASGHPGHDVSDDGGTTAKDRARNSHQHGDSAGHLSKSKTDNIELVSKLRLKNVVPEKIADVGVLHDYAYLAAWGVQTCKYNGVHVVDIRDVSKPKEVAFIPSKEGSYPGEGVQALRIETSKFKGDILVTNNEKCKDNAGFGGMNIYDISRPTAPTPLAVGIGDSEGTPGQGKKAANEIHSVFAWDADGKAYAAIVDNEEGKDLDIVDITDPKQPALIAEYDLDETFPQIKQAAPSNLTEIFLHDMTVKEIDGIQVLAASYWDGGYVLLNADDPKNLTYIGDTDFTNPDPELLESTGESEKPEGNAHYAEFTKDNTYLVGADEDFTPNQSVGRTDDMPPTAPDFFTSQGSDTPQLQDGQSLSGTAVYVGRACNGDAAVPPATSTGQIAVITRGLCTFTEKIANVDGKGYVGAIVINREGSDGCDLFGMSVQGTTPSFSVDRRTGFGFFDLESSYDEAACRAGAGSEIPGLSIGATGDRIDLRAFFDGWGYVHLYKNESGKMTELDTYAVDEAHDPAFAEGFGDLSVHEVATSLQNDNLLYFAYYAAGFRVAEIRGDEIVETGHFIDEGGSNFWGVEAFEKDNQEYVAASDRDLGLYIFKYTP